VAGSAHEIELGVPGRSRPVLCFEQTAAVSIYQERTEGMVPLLSGTACKIDSAEKMTLVCKRKSHLKAD
jgi:hypothetical protein